MVPRFLVLGVTVGTVTLLASTASAQFVLLNGQSRTISTQNTDSDGTPEQDWDRILTYDDDGNVVENALVITDAATGDFLRSETTTSTYDGNGNEVIAEATGC